MYDEVVRAKDSQIRWQQETIAALEAKIAQPIPVKVTIEIPENLMMVSPAVVSRRRTPSGNAAAPDRIREDKPVDWANLDENNPEDLARAAAQELGGPVTPYVLNQTIQRIKANIVRDKYQRAKRTREAGSVGTIEAAQPGLETTYPDIAPHVQRMIDRAAEGHFEGHV